MELTLLYFDDCPNWRETDAHLRALASELPSINIHRQLVETADEADRVGFRGSPTVLIDGVDPFVGGSEPGAGLTCRMYPTPAGFAGSPTLDQLRGAIERAGGGS